MTEQLITEIQRKMLPYLNNEQLMHLRDAMAETLEGATITYDSGSIPAEETDAVEAFITAKRIEGCSEKTLSYYRKTIESLIAGVGKAVQQVTTDDLRRYLTNYQVQRRSSKVTIDNIRRILSSFFSWLEDEDFIVKSPVTYLYFRGKPLYAFGYGLSYTTFAYSNLTVKQENGEVIATVNVQNTGALDGDEVVQLYMSLPGSLRVRPIHALKAFKRVHIKAGETVTVTLNFKIDDLAVWCNGRKIYTVESGVYKMEIGAASDDIRLTADVEIAGEAFPGRPGFFKQEAIDADDYSGVTFLTDKRDGETYVEAKDFRSFLVYKNMDLTGCNAFECAMSAPSGDVEILLADNKTGKVLGKAGGTGTGSLTKFTSFTCDVAAEAGLTELRIVFTKQTSLKWFRFYTV